MHDLILSTSDASFDKVLGLEMPVLVDFWAPWCGPCKRIAPVLEAIAPEYEGRLQIVKMNVDDNPETPARYGVRGIPTLMVFKKGVPVDTHVGALSSDELRALIDRNLGTENKDDEGYASGEDK